ncbi:wall-associated receptor kinase-like 20 [Cynara cardunculus var. scolymus]|uniref:wall-associated receptor kinase-like 20 n=1 Tax=Cynara cardunculus var. scolymus TaxID=59895 RepID=UPI000D62E899|nr:wall-associated receptor kinase-like 20 [Cynara cardunculus var. scolymus]
MSRQNKKQICLADTLLLFLLLCFFCYSSSSQKICPNCGLLKVPYPLSTNPNCGDTDYTLHCDTHSQKLYFDALNGSSYPVLKINSETQKLVIQTQPWLPNSCTTQDFPVSEGLWLNQTLPFNISSSNTIFIFNCSPRLFVSPLNCTTSSLCHLYLENSSRVDPTRALQCASSINPCCTFIAGGLPSAYKIRLHASGCRAFRSIIHLDKEKPASQWEEGVEIQWDPPPEPVCKTQLECSFTSKCLPTSKKGISRCLCKTHYYWDHVLGVCLQKRKNLKSGLTIKITIGVAVFFAVAVVMTTVTVRKSRKIRQKAKVAKEREELFKSKSGMRSARMFSLKELKKATNGFSKDRILGVGGFGEVYKGELQDGTVVAVKSAKVGNIKSTQQVLNEVGILSQVNHKNLVRLLGCCVEAEQPLMIYEYIPRGTLHHHLHRESSEFLNWKLRLKICLQTAEALAYLHTATHTPIYHRDIKSTNILLDDDFNAKVSDFGLSRLARPGLSHVSTCAQGTLGYLDPEYYRNYQLTDKSDVYSYGVVLLEILTTKRAIDFAREEDDVNLAVYVAQRADAVMEVVDRQLVGLEPSGQVMASVKLFCKLALACLREKRGERPTMKDVVQELLSIIEIMNQEEVSYEASVELEII